MQTSSYQSLIENKIEEWQNKLAKLEKRVGKVASSDAEGFVEKLAQLKSAVGDASSELRALDKQENNTNTLQIKEKILKIFDSIDQNLIDQDEKTPFML